MAAKPYPSDPRFLVYESGAVRGPRGSVTFGTAWSNDRLMVTTTVNKVKRSYSVAIMVLETFSGPRPEGCTASHLNGVCQDNRITNLVWESHKDNCARKKEHGTHQAGEKNPAAKLTKQDVIAIRASSLGSRKLAPIYNVSDAHIRNIRRGDTWVL